MTYDDNLGGPVNSDVSYFRDSDGKVRYRARKGVICHNCKSPEVWSPMQTAVPPHVLTCLKCGLTDEHTEFKHLSADDE